MHVYTFSSLFTLTGTNPLSTAIKVISLPYSLPSPLIQLLAQSTGTPSCMDAHHLALTQDGQLAVQ